MRIDKFIWAVRLYKTRSLASKCVEGEKVKLNGAFVKRGKELKIGDEFAVKVLPIWRSYKILAFPKSRVGAKLVADYIVETTSEEDLKVLEDIQLVQRQNHALGLKGRPTKRDRRKLDGLK